jgi:hypothetical protein
MKRFAVFAVVVILSFVSVAGAQPAAECTLCIGVHGTVTSVPAGIPSFVEVDRNELPQLSAAIDALTAGQRQKVTLLVTYELKDGSDALLQVDDNTKTIIEWARLHGPFGAIGITPRTSDVAVASYAIKRLAVLAQGVDISSHTVARPNSLEELGRLFDAGATPYIDAIAVPADTTTTTAAWLAERDPSKKIIALVTPTSPNPMYDAARALADGATYAMLPNGSDALAITNANAALVGDYAFDSTNHPAVLDAKGADAPMPAVVFVRGSDLRSVMVPRGDATTFIVAMPGDQYAHPMRFDVKGGREITDAGKRGARLLAGVQPTVTGYVLTFDRIEKPTPGASKEAMDVATERGLSVEEIIRNHQAYRAYQSTIQPRYIAKNTTKLRFAIGETSETIEATIAGPFFSDPSGRADWAWEEFLVNGVRWKYGRIPELPLVQPEKVTQLPLDIKLTDDYRYQLVHETDLLGYRTYEVRFEPGPNAPATLPLYRGTVWIDKQTWARVRISMVQLNLSGEVLSNEERVDFVPFSRDRKVALPAADALKSDPKELIWLPTDVWAQQVVSAAGRASAVQRATAFTDIRIEPNDYDSELKRTAASDVRMVRETDHGLRYLEKSGDDRVVKEGFQTSRLFLLGGIYHDEGLDYPVVPLGGINYFNFNLFGTGLQTNVFFAGVIVAANVSHPDVAHTRTNVGVDFFGLAVPVQNSMYRNGIEQEDEAIKAVPLGLTLRAGHPIFEFGKIDVSVNALHLQYQRAETTAPNFVTPRDTFVISPSLQAQYSRWGYTLAGNYDYSTRTQWESWGFGNEYNPDQKNFTRYGASFAKSIFLPKFQRIGLDINYIGGQRLDRFSKYELGYFGPQRIRGIESGTVRAETATLAHLSYGFVLSDAFRIEALYDHGWVTDKDSGLSHEPFQGVGIAGQMVGPYGTLVRMDIGKTVGRNAQDGFVANLVFLKLF